jgi:hypothetical protein
MTDAEQARVADHALPELQEARTINPAKKNI